MLRVPKFEKNGALGLLEVFYGNAFKLIFGYIGEKIYFWKGISNDKV
jgi:hypothetical protein